MKREPGLLAALTRRPLLCDGAMGTQLMARGLPTGACGELWNLQQPQIIEAIHRDYLQSGSEILTTNTFGGSESALHRHAMASQSDEINRAGAALARRAAGDAAWVLGDVGPIGGFLEPLGDVTPDQLQPIFQRQIESLYAGGVDGVIVETLSDPAEMQVALAAAGKSGQGVVVATYAFTRRHGSAFYTLTGTTVREAIRIAIDAGADVVGANCGTALNLEDYVDLAGELVAAAGNVPVIVQPNAGSPRVEGDRVVHPAGPGEMAALTKRLLTAGVKIVGGCCGTGPNHLKAMAGALAGASPGKAL